MIFRIRQAASESGVSADTIRVWERRYAAVSPSRDASNIRLYSHEDVRRLGLLHQLTKLGDRIGDIAALSTDALAERLGRAAANHPGPITASGDDGVIRLLLVALAPEYAHALQTDDRIMVTDQLDGLADLQARHGREQPTALIGLPELTEEVARHCSAALAEHGVRRALVLYQFAQSGALRWLRELGVLCLRQPVDPGELKHVLQARNYWEFAGQEQRPSDLKAPIPSARFTLPQLERVRYRSSALRCECPRHLADLISALSSFEAYSRQCENRSSADAALHALLRASAAHARDTMEQALIHLAQEEGWSEELLDQVG